MGPRATGVGARATQLVVGERIARHASGMTNHRKPPDDPVERLLRDLDIPSEIRDQLLAYARTSRATARQHVVPISYLAAWTDADGDLAIWDTDDGRVFPSSPRKMCAPLEFYTVELTSGESSRVIEGVLASVDRAFAAICRSLRDDGGLNADADRYTLALALALQEVRLPQRRRLIDEMATQVMRTEIGDELASNGLDPTNYGVATPSNFHVEAMFRSAAPLAAALAMRRWTLHQVSKRWFVTSDVPLLYDYAEAPRRDVLEQTPIGRELLATSMETGQDLSELSSSIATASHVLLPLSPTSLLEIGPEHDGSLTTSVASVAMRKRAEKLVIRCRERFVIGQPGQDFLRGRDGQRLKRRRHVRFRCLPGSRLGECTMHTSYTYSAEPVSELCGHHF